MSRKNRSPVADYAVYVVIRVVVCILQMLSWEMAGRVAGLLAWLAYHLDRRHRLVAQENLRHAFPGRFDDEELDRVVRAVYRHFAALLIEIVLVPRKLHPTNWNDCIEVENEHQFLDILLSDRPLLIVTGHLGNWELGGYVLGLLGFTTHAVARPLDNPYLDAFLRRFREHSGQKILAKHGDFEQMQELLSGGGVLATLGDQDAGPRGLFVDFFGRPASTHKAIALMALHFQTPILVTAAVRIRQPLGYRLVIEDVILPEEYANRSDAVPALTQRFTTALERVIRSAPEQYFWLHRRWKHQPPKRKAKQAA